MEKGKIKNRREKHTVTCFGIQPLRTNPSNKLSRVLRFDKCGEGQRGERRVPSHPWSSARIRHPAIVYLLHRCIARSLSAIESVVFISDPPLPPRRDYDPLPISPFVVTPAASDTAAGIIAANCCFSSCGRKEGKTDGRTDDDDDDEELVVVVLYLLTN